MYPHEIHEQVWLNLSTISRFVPANVGLVICSSCNLRIHLHETRSLTSFYDCDDFLYAGIMWHWQSGKVLVDKCIISVFKHSKGIYHCPVQKFSELYLHWIFIIFRRHSIGVPFPLIHIVEFITFCGMSLYPHFGRERILSQRNHSL